MIETPVSPSVSTATATRPAIRFLDLQAQFATISDEVTKAISRVIQSQHFILGPEVAAFEEEVARFTGSRFAVGCASGTDALTLALMALGVGRGDEVIVPAFTFGATASCVMRVGAKLVFSDIDPVTFNIDPLDLERRVTPQTKTIIPVHLFGLMADMDAIMVIASRSGLAVVEDAAQAIGSEWRCRRAGSIATMGCFSFFPSKNLGGAGDGGMITTNDEGLADKLRLLRAHGSRRRYEYETPGINSRLDALQAAILRVKLSHLANWTAARQENAERYRLLFAEHGLSAANANISLTVPLPPDDCVHTYNQFTIRVSQPHQAEARTAVPSFRDRLRRFLQDEGIPTEIYYPYPLHKQPAFSGSGDAPRMLREAERACTEVLSLPIYPELSADNQGQVVNAISAFMERSHLV